MLTNAHTYMHTRDLTHTVWNIRTLIYSGTGTHKLAYMYDQNAHVNIPMHTPPLYTKRYINTDM